MPIVFKKDDKFEDLGSIDEFFSSYGDCTVSIDDIDEPNIQLSIVSNQEIEFKLLCSTSLSSIIRQNGGFPVGMEKYRILKITKDNGCKYIRVSQNVCFRMDSEMTIDDCIEATKNWKGNITFSLHMEDIKSEPISKKPPIDPKDLIAF